MVDDVATEDGSSMCKVLIVDDDAGTRRTLSDIIRVQGHIPVAVSTGQEAIDSATISHPEIALVDLRLEDMSGLEVIRQLKEISPSTQCVIITGFSSREAAIQAVNTGVNGYLEKPLDQGRLLEVVHSLADKEEQQRSSAIGILSSRLEDIYALVLKINGFAREHGEILSAHQQWIESHEKEHVKVGKDIHTLSARIWAISGGTGLLVVVAEILQFINL